MLNICLTFDYEIFFGKNYDSEEEILFRPTEKLRKVLESEHISATFFADVCSVLQSRKLGRAGYVKAFEKQIRELYQSGQGIELHIHPNWMYSSFADGEWCFDKESYRLHSFGFEESKPGNGVELIRDCIECLSNMVSAVDSSYRCLAYRAGGFSIQPHRELVKALYQNGIRVDSSIAPHLVSTSSTNSYDYRHEASSVNWWLSSEHEWWINAPEEKESLYEIPVATENKNPLSFLAVRLLNERKIRLHLGPKKGTYINEGEQSRKKIRAYWDYISGYNAISMDAYCADYIYRQLKRYYEKHRCADQGGTIALIGHPKLAEERYVENMRRLIRLLKEDSRFCFSNICEAYQRALNEREKSMGDAKK